MENRYCKIPKELNELSIELNGDKSVELKLGNRLISGRNNLSYIKWYNYSIINHKELNLDYDCISLSFLRITRDELKKAAENIMLSGVSTADTPNIDAFTGNIHASGESLKTEKIQQLVLCSSKGPLLPRFFESDEYYYYTAVHKACYYPLIDDNNYFENDIRHILLKRLWNKLAGHGIVEKT